jgi:hypothetical protein
MDFAKHSWRIANKSASRRLGGDPNLGVAANATNDERRHRWGREVGYARANKIVENPSRPKFRKAPVAGLLSADEP